MDDATGLPSIKLVFQCNIAPGSHAMQGQPGEEVFEILARWFATNFPGEAVGRVQATGPLAWAISSMTGRTIEFSVIL